MSPPIALYVYFRSAAPDALVEQVLAELGRRLREAGWPAPSTWRRPERRDGRGTWMEVHPPQPPERIASLLGALGAAADASGLSALVDGERHVERFVPVAASAPALGAAPRPPVAS